jgi:integrase
MPRLTRQVPSYRHHKTSGRAVVTLNGRDIYLGPYGSPESKAEYDRLIQEWLASGRGPACTPNGATPDLTINELLAAFWDHAERHYRLPDGTPSRELDNLKDALRPLRTSYGQTEARTFGPLALRAVRDAMVGEGLARTTTNSRINRIRRVFRWGVSVQLIPSSIYESLKSVDGLQRGRTEARETRPVKPVAIEAVEATLPHMPRAVAAMVRLQLLTGCRLGEVLIMRGQDLTTGEPNWEYRPASHKNAWRGQERVIPLGPKARAIVREFLKTDLAAYLFDPRETVIEMRQERRVARTSKPTPSELARRATGPKPGWFGDHYTRRAYRLAVVRACRGLGLGPLLDRMPGGLEQLVGESGWQLSHGEKSRLFLARALLQGADLLILDESLAALDPASLAQALGLVLAEAPAVLVVAHP